MSDEADVLVFDAEDAPRLGEKLLARLVAEGVVLSDVTACALGSPGHPPGPQVGRATAEGAEVLGLQVNGLSIESSAAGNFYFSPEGGSPWVTCPRCRRVLETDRLMASIGGQVPLNCQGCGGAFPLRAWTAHACAFGTLACFFWNWRLRHRFIDEVLAWAETPLIRIQYRI